MVVPLVLELAHDARLLEQVVVQRGTDDRGLAVVAYTHRTMVNIAVVWASGISAPIILP